MGRRVLDKPDRRESCEFIGDSKSLEGSARYLSLILEHFRTRFKKEYVTSLREFHIAKKTLKHREIGKGHIVTVYEEKRPRQMWRLGRIVELIRGKDQNIRSAVVRVYNHDKTVNIRRPIKLLYPVELTGEIEEKPIDISGPQITSVMDEHVIDFIS